jgi:hypothetical protein
MIDWTYLDKQMRRYSPYLRDEFRVVPPDSNALATTIGREICNLPDDAVRTILSGTHVLPKDRLDELVAFQSFMELARSSPRHPGLRRAQVITQNYVSFVYLGDACFKALREHAPSGTVTRRCCKFLTDNPVRAFRNALAHANWKYKDDFSGLVFWARKGSNPKEPLARFEVSQRDLGFWQALARCIAYVAYNELTEP